VNISVRGSCQNVLETMVRGTWLRRSHSEPELEAINRFLHEARAGHFLPYSLQREDKMCGNLSFDELEGRMHDLHWFRALCDPEGDTPCCFHNRCVAMTTDACQCHQCYDLRQQIHAELAEWKPSDPECQMTSFTGPDDVCHILHNMTVYVIGDSLLRHVYTSLLTLVRQGKHYGPLEQ
ncbi:unnamed protein product, partial [Lymnaea stagnalis]